MVRTVQVKIVSGRVALLPKLLLIALHLFIIVDEVHCIWVESELLERSISREHTALFKAGANQ